MKRELDLVEDKWWQINNQSLMTAEDHRSQALLLHTNVNNLTETVQDLDCQLLSTTNQLNDANNHNAQQLLDYENC